MHNRCVHCMTAEKALEKEIVSGEIKVFDADVAQQHHHQPRGFPFFVNSETGKSMAGWPGNIENLYKELGISKENYNGYNSTKSVNNPTKPPINNPTKPPINNPTKPPINNPTKPPVPSDSMMCPQNRGGYLTLSQCWVKQKEYSL